MWRIWITFYLFRIGTLTAEILTDATVKGGEFCSLEEFQARCPDDHVIEMLNASFGRMRIGKCITKYPGCDVDALRLLHQNCSGLKECSIQVSAIDKQLKNITTHHCSKEHRLHLEAYYRCIPVESEPDQHCEKQQSGSTSSQTPIQVASTEGYLASFITKQTSKGSSRCPWRIRGLPGQTIQISLLDTTSGVSPVDGVCQIYAYIREGSLAGSMSKLMDCGHDNFGHVFNSLSESVDITIVDNNEDRHFVLHFKAVGCPDIQPKGGAEVVRTGNRTRVVCGDLTWILDCVGDEWVGEIGECHLTGDADQAVVLIPWPKQWGQGLTIVLIMSVAIVIAVVIVVVGVCIVRRRPAHDFQPVSQNSGEYGVYGLQGPVIPGKCYYPTLPLHSNGQCSADGSACSHYATTMQRRQAIPPNGVTPSGGTLPGRTTLFLQQHDVSSCSSCPVHACTGYPAGTYYDHDDAPRWPTFPIRRPEHIYHSPQFARKNKHDPPYYHELDPEEVRKQLMEEQNTMPPPPSIQLPPIPTEEDNDKDSIPPPPPPLPHEAEN